MKIKQNLSLLVWLNRSKGNQFKAPIYIRITIDSEETEISSGHSIDPVMWDSNSKMVLGKSPSVREVNQDISSSLTILKNHFGALQLQYDKFSPEMLKRAYKGKPPIEVETPVVIENKKGGS